MHRVLNEGDLVRDVKRGSRGGHGRTEEENARPWLYAGEGGDDTKTCTGAANIFVYPLGR